MSPGTWSALPAPLLTTLPQQDPDEFDLDIRWGELDQQGALDDYLPTARLVPGETCDTHAATCPDTCHGTCPETCVGTCRATCRSTCQETCQETCSATCREFESCGGTCDGTHCFTCRSGCETP